MGTDLKTLGKTDLEPQNLTELMALAELIAKSEVCPQSYRNKPGDIIVAGQLGRSLGFGVLLSLQTIAVINGRPSIWGDGGLGLVQASGLLEEFDEDDPTKAKAQGFGRCKMKRRGMPNAMEYRFTRAEAQAQNLLGKDSWKKDEGAMLCWRARWRCMRAQFSDVLKGINAAEEIIDAEATVVESEPMMPKSKSGAGVEEAVATFQQAQKDKVAASTAAARESAKASGAPEGMRFYKVTQVEQKEYGDKVWWNVTLLDCESNESLTASTFSDTDRDTAKAIQEKGLLAICSLKSTVKNGKTYLNLVQIESAEAGEQAQD